MPVNLPSFLPGLGAATGTSTGPINSATASLFQAPLISDNFAPDPNQAIRFSQNQSQRITAYSYPDDFPKYYMQMGISVYNRTSPLTVASLNPIAFINLPLPMGLIDNHVIEFASENWPTLGNIVNDTQKGLDVLGSFKNVGSSLQSIRDAGVANTLLNATRYNLNEFTTIMLRGPSYKRYQFHWRFSPRTPDEAYALNTIIAVINNNISPGSANPTLTLGTINFFTFPNVFQLAIFPNSQYMLKFKPAIVENFVVNYAPAGQPAFMRQSNQTPYNQNADTTLGSDNTATATTGVGSSPGGAGNAPEGIEISMQFLELEFWLAGDFKQTNNPYDGVASARGMAGIGAPGFGPFAAGGGGVT